jgi:hypothetical protein
MKKTFFSFIFGVLVFNQAYAFNWTNRWIGAGCKARWEACGQWVQSNCAPGYGGCNGACILFGVRGDCLPNDLQVEQGTDPGVEIFKTSVRTRNYRTKSITVTNPGPRPTYFDPPQKDVNEVRNGKILVVEKGKVKEVQLNSIQLNELGVRPKVEPGIRSPRDARAPANLYE